MIKHGEILRCKHGNDLQNQGSAIVNRVEYLQWFMFMSRFDFYFVPSAKMGRNVTPNFFFFFFVFTAPDPSNHTCYFRFYFPLFFLIMGMGQNVRILHEGYLMFCDMQFVLLFLTLVQPVLFFFFLSLLFLM